MDLKVDALAYSLKQLRQTQLKLLKLGSELNIQNGANMDVVEEIWVLASEVSSATLIIREQADENLHKEERELIRRFNRRVNEEFQSLLPTIHKRRDPEVYTGTIAVEIGQEFQLAQIYEPPTVDASSSPSSLKPAEVPQAGAEELEG